MRNTKYKNGFSLIEVLIAILLVGLAMAALMASNTAFTKANGAGTDLSTAEFLVEQIRELTALLPVVDPQSDVWAFGPEAGETLAIYDDLDDFNGFNSTALGAPIDACPAHRMSARIMRRTISGPAMMAMVRRSLMT